MDEYQKPPVFRCLDDVALRTADGLVLQCTEYSADHGCGCDNQDGCWIHARIALLWLLRNISFEEFISSETRKDAHYQLRRIEAAIVGGDEG